MISLASEPNSGAAQSNNNRASEPDIEMVAPPVPSATSMAEPVVAAQPLVLGGLNIYRSLYKVRNSQVVKCTPMTNGKMKEESMPFLINDVHGYKVVGLPGERVFQIGGSEGANGLAASKQCYELVDGQKVAKTPMFTARSNFGCAVYPNFSQIFIAGGAINATEATKQCERYIVKDDQWKRLPELREAKIGVGLCFFNNGGTLYAFSGAFKKEGSVTLTRSIERLSKGQNNWQLLNVCMPEASMDVGAIQIQGTEQILLFGGFTDNISRNVYLYHTEESGRFENINTSLEQGDFFPVNGCTVLSAPQQIWAGNNSYHKFDLQKRTFSQLEPMQ